MSLIRYDWNNRCEYHNDIVSLAYAGDIPSDAIRQMAPEEIKDYPSVKIDNINHIDNDGETIAEKLLDVFYEQVETNLEDEHEY